MPSAASAPTHRRRRPILVALLAVAAASAWAVPPAKPLPAVPPVNSPFVVPPQIDQGKLQEITRATRLARQAESDGDWERALDLWRAVDNLRPGDYSAYGGIKRSLVSLSRFDEALKFLGDARLSVARGKGGLDPASIAADRVEVLFAAGREKDAQVEIEKQLSAQPDYPNLYRNISNVLYAQRRADDAVTLLRRGRAACGAPFIFAREIAQFAEARMDWETAVSEYLLYLNESSDRLSYVTGALGDIMLDAGVDTLVTTAIARQLAAAEPQQLAALTELEAGLLFRAQRYPEALAAYRRLDQLRGGSGEMLLELAPRLTEEGQPQLALEAYNDFLSRSPPRELLYRTLLGKARTSLALGMVDSARAACEEVLTPGAPLEAVVEANYRIGRIILRTGGAPEAARRYFEAALKIVRQSPAAGGAAVEEIMISFALTYELEAQLDRAQQELEKVVKLAGMRAGAAPQARLELARIAFRRGDIEAVKREADGLLAADATSESANEALELNALLEALKESPAALKLLGQADLLDLLGKPSEAARLLDSLGRAGSSARIREEALWQGFRLLQRLGQSSEALARLDSIIVLGAGALRRDKALCDAGLICQESLADAPRARGYYNRLLDEYPDSPLNERVRRLAKMLLRESL